MVRLVRTGTIVQALFASEAEAKFFYSQTAALFKKAEKELEGR